ncbi:IS5 family transposase [Streptomyces sp. NPDC057927]
MAQAYRARPAGVAACGAAVWCGCCAGRGGHGRLTGTGGQVGLPVLVGGEPRWRFRGSPFRSDHLIVGLGVSLTDAQWARIEPLLPDRSRKRGGRWRDHRQVIDAIAFKFQTGLQWVYLPERYGNWRGVYNRLRMWAVDGTWERVFTVLMAQADADEDLNWAVSVDSTIVRAHQHAAGARKKGPRPASRTTMPSASPAEDCRVAGRNLTSRLSQIRA